VGLKDLGLDATLLRHGIGREVYAMQRSPNVRAFLRGEAELARVNLPSTDEITAAALARWMVPRAIRRPEYREFDPESLMDEIQANAARMGLDRT